MGFSWVSRVLVVRAACTAVVRGRFLFSREVNGRTGIVRGEFVRLSEGRAALALGVGTSGVLHPGDGAHGVVEAQAENLDEQVDGIAGQIPFGPAPVAVFKEESGMGGQFKVARLSFEEWEAAPLKERNERCQPGGADLFAGPARGRTVW